MTRWLRDIPNIYKVATTIVLAAAVVAMYGSLPAQVKKNTEAIERIEPQLERIVCLLAMPEETRVRVAANPFVLERECGR